MEIEQQLPEPLQLKTSNFHVMYSTSAEEREIFGYFLVFQEIGESSRKIEFLVINRRPEDNLPSSVKVLEELRLQIPNNT